ncbi:MAG: hypothetical protein WA792_12065, partial [Pseudolabrys sp.]
VEPDDADPAFGFDENVLVGHDGCSSLTATFSILSWPGLSRPSRSGAQCFPKRDRRDKPGDDNHF